MPRGPSRHRNNQSSRKRKRNPQVGDNSCPCGCGVTDLSDRTKYYHLAGRGLPVADTEADHCDDVYLEPGLDVVPGAEDDVQSGGDGAPVDAGDDFYQHADSLLSL